MKEPILFRRSDCLRPEQALYWKDLLYRTIKIGAELEFALPKGVKKADFLPVLIETVNPTRDLNNLGKYGVLDIRSEHCGIEMQIIGRQPHYSALLQQYRAILSLLPKDIRVRPTCGLHFHVIAVGLSDAMPEIVLANVWNLTRRYAPEMRFLTSGGDRLDALCRRRNYCSHIEMVRWSPGFATMQHIQQHLKDSIPVPEHNNFLNLEHLRFYNDGSVQNLHYENRFPDADISATSIAAKTFLFLAVLIKAVELSQHGLIHVGHIEEWRHKVDVLDKLSNNDGPLATSDTSQITPQIIDELRAGCREMLEFLKPIFGRLARVACEGGEEHPAFEVLCLLAETPVSLLRASGRSWEEIDCVLAERASAASNEIDQNDQRLIRLIELAMLTGRMAPEAWKWDAARELYLTPQELERRLTRLASWRGLKWDVGLGTMVFLA